MEPLEARTPLNLENFERVGPPEATSQCELQVRLIAKIQVHSGRCCQPFLQLLPSYLRECVDLLVWPFRLIDHFESDQTISTQAVQGRIHLTDIQFGSRYHFLEARFELIPVEPFACQQS